MANIVCSVRAFRANSSAGFSVLVDVYADNGAGGSGWLDVATPLSSAVAQLNNAVIAAATTFASSNMGVTLSGGEKLVLIGAFSQ